MNRKQRREVMENVIREFVRREGRTSRRGRLDSNDRGLFNLKITDKQVRRMDPRQLDALMYGRDEDE